MKNLLTCICGLLFCAGLMAQKDFEKETLRILPESELIIAGSTNVNKFDCRFDIGLITNTRSIKYSFEENYLYFPELNLHLSINGFDCGNRRMNEDFCDLLKSETYPEIKIKIDKIELISAQYSKAYITVKLAGVENMYNLPVQIEEDRFKGQFKMNIRDFGLEPPTKALGLIEVNEEIEVRFNLLVQR
ncbi:YceI family protein [Christiangramia crocea]|uniref:YceI family protein n=1 Tax=Christiangramia crocea TaxID=2904124 RepID=A0A9X1UWI0_9FLAO|nr:YceI family protein [Gramella crocea]MCG9971574.1 YceI family protein [Gramella crocea]